MKIITVKDDLAGGKVAFEILSEKLAAEIGRAHV